MSDSHSGIWSLIKSVHMPVDIDILKSVYKEIREDAKDTSWLQLLYRLEGVSILILIPGIIILGGVAVHKGGVGISEIQTIGAHYAIGLSLIFMFLLAKIIVRIVQRVNDGDSIWGEQESNIGLTSRITLSILLIIMPVFAVFDMEISVYALSILFLISCMILGSVMAGVCGIFSSILIIKSNFGQDKKEAP